VLVVLSVALLGFAPAPFPRAERRRIDPNDVSGVWDLVASQSQGRPDGDQGQYVAEIGAGQLTFVRKSNRQRTVTYELRLYPEQAPPAFTWGLKNAVMFVGSYRLNGNELTLVFAGGNRIDQRPRDIDGTPEYRYVFRRARR
jgi:uncharacterized protein (TIGR03067 family)